MSDRITVDFDVPARMRDGVMLRANVYRPEGPGPWPTLLARSPYGKHFATEGTWSGVDPVHTAKAGFMVVTQDTRGRFASDGAWDPFATERQDGYDAVEWAARLPGSNGRVGMYGGSYWGNSQWMAAGERPPSLAAISPALTWADPLDGLFARGGAVELGLAVPWSLEQGVDFIRRTAASEQEARRRIAALVDDYDRLGEAGYRDLPVHELAVLRRHGVPDIGAIRALGDPAIAERCRVTGFHERVAVPSLTTAGWHDIFLQGSLDNYEAMAARGVEARLVVGPWTHATFADPIGGEQFGVRAGRDGTRLQVEDHWAAWQLDWLRRHLDPEARVELPEKPVRIFVMGRNEWRDEQEWPLARAREQRWFLTGSRGLTPRAPEHDEPPSAFVYDPADPVPTVGGLTVMWPGCPAGPADQREVEAREDVLVFTSEPLEADLEVTGRVRVVLHAQSSAPSTDWVARLCDVHPDGRSINLCDGVVRVAEGADAAGQVEIDLWSTSNAFLRGHRIRVHVTSSSFPRWDRNLNTGDQRRSEHRPARQRIHTDASRPSYVSLPIVG